MLATARGISLIPTSEAPAHPLTGGHKAEEWAELAQSCQDQTCWPKEPSTSPQEAAGMPSPLSTLSPATAA